jgi:hypothetical protein
MKTRSPSYWGSGLSKEDTANISTAFSSTLPYLTQTNLRELYWRMAGQGVRLPAQRGVILLRGRVST